MSKEIRSLFQEYEFIRPEVNDVMKSITSKDFSIVNEKASNLLLSYIADRIGRRYGMNTITDFEIGFIVNALDAMESKSLIDPESLLASSIISSIIPQEVQYVDIKTYKEIRDEYSGIRGEFQKVVSELTNLYHLNRIEDKDFMKSQVADITSAFTSEFDKFKTSTFGRNVKKWVPIGLSSLSTLVGTASCKPSVALAGAFISVGIQFIDKLITTESKQNNFLKILAKMGKRILEASQVKELMLPEYSFL